MILYDLTENLRRKQLFLALYKSELSLISVPLFSKGSPAFLLHFELLGSQFLRRQSRCSSSSWIHEISGLVGWVEGLAGWELSLFSLGFFLPVGIPNHLKLYGFNILNYSLAAAALLLFQEMGRPPFLLLRGQFEAIEAHSLVIGPLGKLVKEH